MSEPRYADVETLIYIKRLNEKLAAKTAECEALKHDIARHVQTCAELATENEGLREDAERYRWLRNDTSPFGWQKINGVSAEKLDAAIDAARKETP